MEVNNEGASIGNQTNIEAINFGAVQNPTELASLLQQLLGQVQAAQKQGALDEDSASEAKNALIKAANHVSADKPEKDKVIRHLNTAKDWLTSVNGLATAVNTAIKTVGILF